METVLYSQWLPSIQVNVPGCPRAMVIEAIRSKAIEFCDRSRFWRKELDGFYTVADDEEYDIETPVETAIADILLIKVDGHELSPKTQDEIEADNNEWRDSSGRPDVFFLRDTKTAVFVPIPDSQYAVRVLVALKPTQAAQGVDEIVFEEHKDTIMHGALAYLMQMPEKTWTNPNLSIFHQGKYDEAVTKAKNKADRGYALRKTFRVKAHFI